MRSESRRGTCRNCKQERALRYYVDNGWICARCRADFINGGAVVSEVGTNGTRNSLRYMSFASPEALALLQDKIVRQERRRIADWLASQGVAPDIVGRVKRGDLDE